MWQNYISVTSIDEAIAILTECGETARIIAGATDLLLEMERGARKGIETLVDVTRIPGLDRIRLDEDGMIHLGPLVTHNHVVATNILREHALPLVQACWEVGAPQIRNRGTVAGNLITASPANDTIPALMALGADVALRSARAERRVSLNELYTGVRRTVMQPDEMLVDIAFPAMTAVQKGISIKIGLRRAQAISLANVAMILTFDGARLSEAIITLGAVAPTVVHAWEAESFLKGRILDDASISQSAELSQRSACPIDDIRSPADYRKEMVRVTVNRGLRALAGLIEPPQMLEHPPVLWGQNKQGVASSLPQGVYHTGSSPIVTRINGKEYTFARGQHKTLLRLLREDAGLTGTKEGCTEGECGACTVFLDGLAVMACLVPAPRAHGAEVVTVEGITKNGQLHSVQQAFIDEGAVQCGYCTPGFVMSAVKLLEENPHPSREEIQQAITGNLCRCTGYYAILTAIERAAGYMEV